MLTTRPTKRTGREHLALGYRLDLFEGETLLGRLVVERKSAAAFTLGETAFTVAHFKGLGLGETPLDFVTRLVTKKPKPEPDRYELKDAQGKTLARAVQNREVFEIDGEGGPFVFAKDASLLLFALKAEGASEALGVVGQRKRFTRSLEIDLPERIARPVQIFLLALYLHLLDQRAANSST